MLSALTMKRSGRISFLFLSFLVAGCTASDVKTVQATLGQQSNIEALASALNRPGLIEFEKHIAANWQVPLSGMLNLDNPKARAAGFKDGQEAIQLFVYTLRHPERGTYIIDSGVSERFSGVEPNSDISFLVKHAMGTTELEVVQTTKQLVGNESSVAGVFLTHIHMDHIMGLTDVGADVPVYIGPGDTAATSWQHAATRGTTNRLLAGTDVLQEWQFNSTGIIDVFSDGLLWAIHSPGHSPGSTAYLALTTVGPQLIVGDVSHTRWGWDNQVEPGTYSADTASGVISLNRLASLVVNHPSIIVHPGHQN